MQRIQRCLCLGAAFHAEGLVPVQVLVPLRAPGQHCAVQRHPPLRSAGIGCAGRGITRLTACVAVRCHTV